MSEFNITYQLVKTGRAEIRKELLRLFSNEEPGTGTGENCSKYKYYVDNIGEYKIVLQRPAPLNKGLDFIIRIDGLWFKKSRRYNAPGHSDIVNALNQLKDTIPEEKYEEIKMQLANIFICKEYDLSGFCEFTFEDYEGNKHPIAIIILAAKWLFVEQDMTYWNWSGRNMLWNALIEAGLV